MLAERTKGHRKLCTACVLFVCCDTALLHVVVRAVHFERIPAQMRLTVAALRVLEMCELSQRVWAGNIEGSRLGPVLQHGAFLQG